MMRSMFAAVSGLRAHQQMMDVVGDNIANVNTAGFKASRVLFEDTLSQAIRGGSAASTTQGGVNPEAIGLGVKVGAIDMVDTQGAMQNTGRPTDVAIQGAGYFVVRQGTEDMYTRAGSFGFDSSGNLVDPSGMVVQGWLPDATTGVLSTTGPASDLKLPLGQVAPPKATTSVQVGGNISADAAAGTVVSTSITVIDTLGAPHKVTVDLTKDTTANTWHMSVTDDQGTQTGPDLSFDPTTGALTSPTSAPTFNLSPTTGATPSTYSIDFGTTGSPDAITQFGGSSTAIAINQDGTQSSYVRSFSIADDGTISGVYSDGRTKTLGQIAIATFNNPGGLVKSGEGHFRAGQASGAAVVSAAGTASAGTLSAGELEMSNVDLAQEFTNLIIAQRGFQANAKVISASDEMLQDLVNLKR